MCIHPYSMIQNSFTVLNISKTTYLNGAICLSQFDIASP